jgi:hypothetical protein
MEADVEVTELKQREESLEGALTRAESGAAIAEQNRLKGLLANVRERIQNYFTEREIDRILAEEREFEFRQDCWRQALGHLAKPKRRRKR